MRSTLRLTGFGALDNRLLTDSVERWTILSPMDWAPKRVAALLFSLWIGWAPALLSGSVASMTLQMAQAQDAMPGDCDCCPESRPTRALCLLMCIGVPPLLAPECGDLNAAVVDDEFAARRDAMMTNRIAPPDPPPPRRLALA
jgi:hypothetical protein